MFKIKYLAFATILLLAFILAIASTKSSLLGNLENKIHDFFFIARNRLRPQPVPQDIVIIAIDEASFQELKEQWPWPRQIHARLIDNLYEADARVIAFDIVFADPTDPADDDIFSASIKRADNVVLASSLDITEDKFVLKKSFVEPLDKFKFVSRGVGLANLVPDMDNFMRRIPLEIEETDIFSLETARAYLAWRNPRYSDDNYLYKKLNIKDPAEPIIINYIGPPGSFRVVSYYQALDYKNYLPEDIFKGKIALIGLHLEVTPYTTTKTLDSFATPFFSATATRMFGVEVHANIINTLLRDIQIRGLNSAQVILILLALLLLSAFLILPLGPLYGSISAAALIICYIIIAIYLFISKRTQIPVLYPFLQTVFVYIETILYDYVIAERISIHDPLTSLLNRRNLDVQIERSIHHAFRHHQPLSLAMADIDHFKDVNDTYGHQAGDYVLKEVARLLKKNLKGYDIIGRYGGEEFCIIMPRTELSDAKSALDNLRETIAGTKMELGPSSVTVSFGISSLAEGDSGKSIIKRADDALYNAKSAGRNRVEII